MLVAFAPIAIAFPARAQSSADDATTDMARARFKEGVGYFDKGQFDLARAAFLQAYALKKHPAVLLNLAWSCLKSGHTLEAERYFKQFLVESKDVTDKQKSDAVDGLNQAHAKLGRIEVVAAPGTDVTIDGDHAGTAPLAEPAIVEPGAHTIKFRGTDGTTDTDSVTVLAGEKAIARFAKTASAAATAPPAATATTPPPSDTETPSTPPPPPEESTAPPPKPEPHEEPQQGGSHNGLLIPVIIGGAVTLGTAGLAAAMLFSKQNAQNNANSIANQIVNAGGTSCSPPTAPAKASAQLKSQITSACSQWAADNNDVNSDATVGNVALAVAILAGAGEAAMIIYWIAADHHHDDEPSKAALHPVLTPFVGPSTGGLTLSGSF